MFRVAGPIAVSPSFVGGGNGLFVSTANQTNPVALDTAIGTPVNMTNTNGVIKFTAVGVYQIISELFYTSTTGANPTISQWLTQNGSNIANSTQDFQLLGGANTVQGQSCVWIITAALNDTFQVYWSTSNTNVSLTYQAALTNPVRPASPSAVLAITRVG